MKLDIEGDTATMAREIEGGIEYLDALLPFVAGCQEPIAEWKIPNMRGIMMAKRKPIKAIPPVEVAETVRAVEFEYPPEKTGVKLIDPENMDELVNLLHNEAKVI